MLIIMLREEEKDYREIKEPVARRTQGVEHTYMQALRERVLQQEAGRGREVLLL